MPNISDFCGYCGKLLGGHCCEKRTPMKAVIDPWVVVGTTTIDGFTNEQFGDEVGCSFDYFLTSDHPVRVGGRYLKGRGSQSFEGRTMLFCDIVRRQSDINAERQREAQTAMGRDLLPHVDVLVTAASTTRETCPECGPHGNRGEVLLASSWAKCTTCAGGKPGDLWGEVKAHEPATAQGALSSALIAEGASAEVVQTGVRAFIDALNRPPSFDSVGHKPGQLEKLADLHLAELGNLRRSLMGPPDGMSREEYRRIMFGEWVPEPINIRITES